MAEIIRRAADNYNVIVVDAEIIRAALAIMSRFRLSFFDSQIIAAALAGGADVLYSEDLHPGQIIDGKLTILSPFKMEARQTRKRYAAVRPGRVSAKRNVG